MSKYFTRRRNEKRAIGTIMEHDLAKFKKIYCDVHTSFEYRLKILKRFSEKVYYFTQKEYNTILRDKFRKKKKLKDIVKGKCKLCEEKESECRHHIIQINHGGFALGRTNLIPLCNDCHNEIHPWLKMA